MLFNKNDPRDDRTLAGMTLSLSFHSHTLFFFYFNIREEMRSLQAALQKQLDEAAERAEKHQATVRHLKERRSVMMECSCSSDSSPI